MDLGVCRESGRMRVPFARREWLEKRCCPRNRAHPWTVHRIGCLNTMSVSELRPGTRADTALDWNPSAIFYGSCLHSQRNGVRLDPPRQAQAHSRRFSIGRLRPRAHGRTPSHQTPAGLSLCRNGPLRLVRFRGADARPASAHPCPDCPARAALQPTCR
jgi:hypothetical protein